MKNKLSLWSVLLFVLTANFAIAQSVSGVVSDAGSGEPLPGVAVSEKGTNNATLTDFDGKFTIKAANGTTLVFSTMGMETKEVVASSDFLQISLEAASSQLDEVVVTALGISREKKSLGYATQEVDGSSVSTVKDANFMNTLSGKVAGVSIKSSGTLGGSSNVVIRGYKSLTGNNQALFVVDGVPISNATGNSSNVASGRGGYDYGNAAMDINPEDIENISVLKGAAATAIYGSRASNGVVMITTKSGKSTGKKTLGITASTGIIVGSVNRDTWVRHQQSYGPGYGAFYGDSTYINDYFTDNRAFNIDVDGDGVEDVVLPMGEDASWGLEVDPSLDVYDWESIHPLSPTYGQSRKHVAPGEGNDAYSFWQQSVQRNNNIAINGGNDQASFRLSATDFSQTGIVPGSLIQRSNISFSGSFKASDKLTVSAKANYVDQNGKGRYGTGYDSRNPNQSFRQWYNVLTNMTTQREYYEQTGANITWNPYGYASSSTYKPHYFDNFYHSALENYSTDGRNRIIGNIMAEYQINDWMKLTGRMSADTYSELREERIAVGSVDVSSYYRQNRSFTERNNDLFLNWNKYFGADNELSFAGMVGINQRRTSFSAIGSGTNGGLVVPGVYALSNSVSNPAAPSESEYQIGVDGMFAQASFGYKNFLYVDVTGRQDVSSTLPVANNTYFYPSATLSFIFSEFIDIDGFDFGKIRANYASVGSDAPAQALADAYGIGTPFNGVTLASAPSTQNNADLLAENTVSTEFGLEMKFLKNRVGIDVSIYQSSTFDQILPAQVSSTTGTVFKYVNAGQIDNNGTELSAYITPVKTNDFQWDVNVNWSRNRNEVVELFGDSESLLLASGQGGFQVTARVGQPYGTIEGTSFVRDEETGSPLVYDRGSLGAWYHTGDVDVIGNIQADWRGGINNSFRYKNLTLSALLDAQMGGSFYSLDTKYGYYTGVYDFQAGVNSDGVKVRESVTAGGGLSFQELQDLGLPVEIPLLWDGTYDADGNMVGVTENSLRTNNTNYATGYGYYAPNEGHVYDASFVKLRELSVTYQVPTSKLGDLPIAGVDVSLVGRNLAILYKNTPYSDPEAGLSAGNVQGYQSGAYPSLREVGLNLRVKF
ncbi:SusC/RagA family TonB-linked outer membrane protein [Schleiferiaceae bacterium]|nr:SusC/RagA family TonB-linked outer membrane protein [Schleiferiaceae bacterium]